jgi:translocation and assembly module TamB
VDVSLDWKFRDLDIRAEGNISRGDSLITASLATASVTEPNTGRWALNDAVLLEIADNRVSVSRHAWTSDVGELQVSRFESNGGDFELEADLVSLPLQFANTFLPENLRLSGTATADIDIRRENEAWIGVINWQQKDTALRILSVNDDPIDVIIPVAELGFDLQNGGALIAAKMTIEPGVVAELDLALAELSRSSNVTAELRLEGREWFWIPALLPTIDNFEGDIAATVRATGPLLSPEFSGSLDWREGSLAVPALNVPVSEIDLTMAGTSAGAATVSASAKAGEGDLSVSGRLENMMLPSRSVNMRVRGSSAELINWPEYHVWASPDFIVVGTREGWVFSGSLDVPKAEISVSELSADAVSPSPDIVVVGREETESAAPTRIDGVARLTLGDGVHVTAFGLDTKLRGNLQVRMFKDRPATAEGRVSLVEGTFSAYGQTLSIEEGTLTFTGPLDNPIVDVRAVRTIESLEGAIKAGLHLQGRAQNISSTVYSDPVMSEADALSYVVVGRPLSQATESEGSELSSAALALGVRQAGRITDQIGQSLGLDQLTVAGNGGDTTALVAGKQLNSRLHARYAYGVFSRLGTLLIRYRLSQRLTLEAGAGEAQSIDLLYLVEKE